MIFILGLKIAHLVKSASRAETSNISIVRAVKCHLIEMYLVIDSVFFNKC